MATLVTVVALGETGVQVRQTDAYKAGKAWYRTDVELLNAADDREDRHGLPRRALRDRRRGRPPLASTTRAPRWPAATARATSGRLARRLAAAGGRRAP